MATAQKKGNDVSRSVSMPSNSHRREVKATTLPANSRPISNSSGEGFFTKLKRCLRIGSKGRYNVTSVQPDQHQSQEPVDNFENNRKIMSRATSLRGTRRSHVDKEDVILIHKSKIQSGVGLLPNRSVSESIPEDREQMIVHIVNGGFPVNTEQNGSPAYSEQNSVAGAEAALDVDDVFEAEMDPGYETLDEIRKKVRMQAAEDAAKRSQAAKVTINNTANHAEFETAGVAKPDSLPETKDGSPPNESSRDSGITTPTTESPESGRDGPSRSVTSSMFSDTPLTEESSQPDTGEHDQDVGGVIQRLNSCPASNVSKPLRDGQRYSSDSVLTKPLQSDTDSDLYANPQILFRKQSRMGQSKSVSASTIAVDDSATKSLSDTNRFGEKSVSDSDLKPSRGASVDSDTGAPPLPDRGYLDNNARLSGVGTEEEHSADNDCSTSTTLSANQELSQSATQDSVASISSIREVGGDNSECLQTPEPLCPELSSETESSSTSIKSEEDLVTDAGACAVFEKPSDSRTSELIDSVALSKATEVSSLGTETCETVERTLLDSAERSQHNEDVAQTSVEDNCTNSLKACHSDTKYIATLPDSKMCLSGDQGTTLNNSPPSEESKDSQASASQDSAHSVKSQEFRQDNIRCDTAISVSDKTVVQTSNSKVIAESKVLEPHAQNPHSENPSADIQTPECSDPDLCVEEMAQKDSVNDASSVAGLHSIVDADSIEVVERRITNRNGNSDQTCAKNVVVIKLHESAHEDSLLSDDKAEEGVSDETIARLEEKASMLKLGGRGKFSPGDSSKDIDQSLQTVLVDASSSKSNECAFDMSDDVKGAVGGSENNSMSASVGEGARQKTGVRRLRKKEPIHMSLAELMSPPDDESMSDGDEDYQDVMEDEEDEEDGASANQTNQNATNAAHRAFLESMRQLKDCGWYWGPLSYNEAVNKLLNKPDGSFLVRDSSNENYILSLSFKCMGSVCHTRIEHNKGVFSFWSQPDSHGTSTIKDFIEQAVHFSHSGKFLYFLRPSGPGSPPIAIRLLHPVSRFCRVPSLQHMCRFLILRWVRRDHIDVLPVPEKVKNYLRENQYYVETLEED
ncbi:microtubule-associated protein futsch-like [Haliotis rufescens]|uniref:microtubule-associated protein futsch-like n=1 Tax=Haliotis rufescens TaxID=6454 RepID=UPI00201FAA33|nr:microtubule-associated protein futsch-like [Haliotis rufescens]